MREETFEGVGGLKIFFRTWLPASNARGVLVLSHGFNSHSGYYSWPPNDWRLGLRGLRAGPRGRGRSEG